MTTMARRIPGDWYDGETPPNVVIADDVSIETSYSFALCRSQLPDAIRIGRGSSVYLGTMFDLGREARVTVGEFAMLNGVRVISDAAIEIGDYALLSWNVVLMDSYRASLSSASRREYLRQRASGAAMPGGDLIKPRPIRIGRNVWIGFDVCVLPGVWIGQGAVIGARSVVCEDVPPFAVAVGNPARVVRTLKDDERASNSL